MHAYDAVDVDDNVSYCPPFWYFLFLLFLLLFLVIMSPVRM